MRSLALIALISALALAPATGQEPPERFRMVPTPGGFLEIDSRTGAVSECTRGTESYQCRPVPHDQSALQVEIDRLARENADLKERLARPPQPPMPGQRVKPPSASIAPSDEEIERALGVMERFLRRFMSIMREEKPDRT